MDEKRGGMTTASPPWLLAVSAAATVGLSCYIAFALASKKRDAKGSKKDETYESYIPGVPNVPGKHWFFGHMYYPTKEGSQLQKQEAWCVEHADPTHGMCLFYLMNQPVLAVNKAEHAQKILMSSTTKPKIKVIERLGERIFGKTSVANINGREWKVHRAPVTRALQAESALVAAQRHILQVGEDLVGAIKARAREDDDGKAELEIVSVMKMATIDVFGAAALGQDIGSVKRLEPSELAVAFDYIFFDFMMRGRHLLSPSTHIFSIPTEANRRSNRAVEVLHRFLRDAIHEQVQLEKDDKDWSKRNNLLSQMIALQRSKTGGGELRESDVRELSETITVLLFAGYDTTANALSFALHEIAMNPVVEQACLAEATAVLGEMEHIVSKGSNLEDSHFDVLSKFPYCYAVLQEALRLHPPASGTIRKLDKDLTLDGISIPKGTLAQIPIYNIQRDGRYFPRPLEFLPERWVRRSGDGSWVQREGEDRDEEGVKGRDLPPPPNRDAFLPFSAGARNCAGRRFSLQEGTLLLAILVRSLKFKPQDGYTMEHEHKGPIMSPSKGLPMRIVPRET